MTAREVLKEMLNSDLTLQRRERLIEQYAKQEKIKLLEKINKEKYNVKLIINQELKNLKQ